MLDIFLYAILLVGFILSLLSAHLSGTLLLTTVPTYDTPYQTLFFTIGVVLSVVCFASLAYKFAKWRYHPKINTVTVVVPKTVPVQNDTSKIIKEYEEKFPSIPVTSSDSNIQN